MTKRDNKAKRDSKVNLGVTIKELINGRPVAWLALELTKAENKMVSRQTVQAWVDGDNNPTVAHIPHLCRIFGVDPNFLFGWQVGREFINRRNSKAA